MKYIVYLLLFFVSKFAFAQSNPQEFNKAKELSDTIIEHLKTKEFEKIHFYFDNNLKEKLSKEEVEKKFNQLSKSLGEIEEVLDFDEKVTAEGTTYLSGLQFKNGKFDLSISLNKVEKIESITIKPYKFKGKWKMPAYVNEKNYTTESIKIGNKMPLLGEFVTTKTEDELTIVVMVHGSGPNDMDESMGPNKIFKDLAYGLANQGISSIRYNKRSYDYPTEMTKYINSITIDQLVVDDAVNAIELAKEFGAKKVILIGHSLGGHMAPKIAEKAKLSGVITLAGNASPLSELILPQYEYLMLNDPETQITEIALNTLNFQLNKLNSGDYDSTTVGAMLPLGLPGSFWFSLKDYKPTELAKKQDQPYLILNGERDYQVTEKEAKKWKNGNKYKASKTIIYPKLNHLFYAGEGILLPSEYEQEAHFDERVLNDIAQWIKSL